MRLSLGFIVLVLMLCSWSCTPPPPVQCPAISSVVNKTQQGDFLLTATVYNSEGSCAEERPSRPCEFDVRFELQIRVPGSANRYEPVKNHPGVVEMLKKMGKRLVWSGGELRGNNDNSKGPVLFSREKTFRQSANTGKGYTLHLSTRKEVELYPLNSDRDERGELNLSLIHI